MKQVLVYPDAERAVIDLLEAAPEITVGVGQTLPGDWTVESAPFLQVMSPATPVVQRPVAFPTVAVVAWAGSTTTAKELANLALGVLEAHDGSGPISAIRILTGAVAGKDPDSHAPIASGTVRAATKARIHD